jgi:hypothetical protein
MTEVGIGLMLLVFALGTYFSYREPENVGGAGQGWKPPGVMIQAWSPRLSNGAVFCVLRKERK